ncbi:MAG: LPS-assembly protein LptD [Candidatus Kapabacteria bacterium]|nr:LPS-assembly protein LptD [Candidatus Kapabacteria bacterium]
MRIAGAILILILAGISVQGQDTTALPVADTARIGGVDTIVVFSAADSARLSLKSKRLRLRGKADAVYGAQRLQSEVIVMDFGTSLLTADGVREPSGRLVGFPVFSDAGSEYAGESILFNVRTRRGRVTMGETSVDGGFYYGSSIKRVEDDVAYIRDGCFTTCDAPHPHFYFNSPRMKVMLDDKIFLDPVLVYVEDIPVFALPIGLFFSLERGRRSGLIMPTPLVSSDRGVILQNTGYYFALSDYLDTEIAADIMTKGGVVGYSRTRYALRDRLSGNLNLTTGYTRQRITDDFSFNFGVQATHQQQLRPGESINALIEYTTQNLLRRTSINVADRVRQNARSSVSYQRTFFNGHTFNANYNRDQNIFNGSVTEAPTVTYGVPQFMPLKGLIASDHWLSDLALSYRSSARYNRSQQRAADTGVFAVTENGVIEHRPTLTVTPKLGFMTIAPSVSYSENWWFQRYTESVNPSDSTVRRTRASGMFRDYTYSVGVTASTILYGLARPNAFGITALRHTVQPNIGLFYVPDQRDTSLGFFGSYVSPITGNTVRYNRFTGGIASAQRQLRLDMNILNRIAVKVAREDTLPDTPIELLTFNVSTSYNMAADSLRLAPITIGVRTPFLEGINFNAGLTMNAYDQVQAADPVTGRTSWVTIDRTLLAQGKGLARITNVNVQFGTRFSSKGIVLTSNTGRQQDTAGQHDDALRSRFDRRINYSAQANDLFGDGSPGWTPVQAPWDVDVNVSYSYSAATPAATFQSLLVNVGGNISITPTLRMSTRASFDLITGQINTPVIDISKRIHCWNLALNWVPTGFQRGFFLRFSADAAQLRDLQITRQSTPLFR